MSTSACGGAGWTERIAWARDPPSKRVIVIWNAPPTSLVPTVNVALLELAATVTDVGRVRTLFVSLLDNWTTAPPAGAAPDSEIGRASCRGKSVDLGGRRIIKKKKIRTA